jgi:hypothetical protein
VQLGRAARACRCGQRVETALAVDSDPPKPFQRPGTRLFEERHDLAVVLSVSG